MRDGHDIDQTAGALVRWGVVTEVDTENARCLVDAGAGPIGPMPWLAWRAGDTIVWSPPTVGEQVLVLCPEGDELAAVAVPGAYSTDFLPPNDGAGFRIRFKDGAEVSYDDAAHQARLSLPAGGKVTLTADAGVKVEGPLEVTGDITGDGKITASGDITSSGGDVVAGSVHLKTHTHTDPQGGVTGGPT